MALATLSIDLIAKLASFEADLGKAARVAEKQAAAMAAAFDSVKSAVAGLGVAALLTTQLTSVRAAIDKLDAIDDLSEKYGIAASKLQAYTYASEVAGTSTEALATGLNKLSRNITAAAGGSAEQVEFFRAMGVSIRDASGNLRSADEVLLDLADRFAGYKDGAAKATDATIAFGKTGTDLLPFLNKGKDGIQQLMEEAQRLGLVMGDAASKAAGDFNDNMKRLQLSTEAAYLAVANKFLPGLVQLTDTFIGARREGGLLYGVLVSIGQGFAALTGQDELGKLQSQAKGQSAEIERLTGILIGLDNVLQRDPGNDNARRRYENISATLRRLQNEAVDTGIKIKALADQALNPKAEASPEKPDAPTINTKAAAAADAAEKSYRKLIEAIEERGRLARAELENNTKLDEAEKFRIASLAKLNLAENGYSAAMKAAGRAKVEQVARDIEAVESRDRIRQITEQAAAAEQAQLQAIEATSQARVDENRTLRDYIDQLGLTAEQLEQVRIKRLENQLAVEQDLIRQAQIQGASAAEILQMKESAGLLQRQVELRQRLAAAQSTLARDPFAGASQGVKDYLDQIGKAGDASRSAVAGALNTLEDDLTRSLATGKGSVSAFIDQVQSEIFRLAIVRPFLNDLFGALGAGKAGSLFGNLFSPQGSLISAVTSLFGFADGGAFNAGQVVPFAAGGVFDSPHIFKFAQGGAMQTGVLGEAGPEAILPLRRGANGKLGVVASGGGRSVVLSPTIQISIDARTDQAVVQQLVNQGVQSGMGAVMQQLRNEGVRA